uniref:U6 snRNA-associated Sm-like protein LSm4 n=2 Tax=Apocrita TaxID=7400 RepID=A0ABD2WXW4_9HYME
MPLSLLRTAQNHPMLVELKNGETYNGHLVSCDNWMNINLREVICTSRDGDKFWRMPECYIRGSTIKYLRIPDEVIDMVKEDVQMKSRGRGDIKSRGGQNQRGGRGNNRSMSILEKAYISNPNNKICTYFNEFFIRRRICWKRRKRTINNGQRWWRSKTKIKKLV